MADTTGQPGSCAHEHETAPLGIPERIGGGLFLRAWTR